MADELLLHLDPSVPGKGAQLRLALRDAIADGVLSPGTKLPSSRTLAAQLSVARGVVVEIYEQLAAEGWLTARRGSGTAVAGRPSTVPPRAAQVRPSVAALDLRPARPDVSSFPRSAWTAATRAVLADLPHGDLSYGDHRGHVRARDVVAAYLGRVRGVRATPDHVLMSHGFSAGLATVVATLVDLGVRTVAAEDPGGYEPRRVVVAAGARIVPVPVDDQGLRVEVLEGTDAGAVLLTPAHQYPMGHVLSAERRTAIGAWARRTGGWILEDDYDAEFRYDREPVGAVQALVPDRTVHLGSVAKTLAPAIRVGWLVAPEELLGPLERTRDARESQQGTLEQLVIAHLIDAGVYDRHLRAVRRRYRERRDALVEALEEAGLGARVRGVAAGLHAVIQLDDGEDDVAVTAAARAHGVELVALSRYAIEVPARGLVLGFSQRSTDELRRAVAILAEVLDARATPRQHGAAEGS